MTWTIEYSRDADRFIQAEGIQGEVNKQMSAWNLYLPRLLAHQICRYHL